MNRYLRFILGLSLLVVTTSGWCDLGGQWCSTSNQKAVSVSRQPVTPPLRDRGDQEEVFTEDFEGGAEGWTSSDLSVVAWHKSDFQEREGEGLHWWCGDTLEQYDGAPAGYDNIWLQYLDTPVLDLSEAGDGLTLTFDAWWLLEDPRLIPPADPYDGWDGFLVLISIDGGGEFAPIEPESPEYTAELLSAAARFWGVGDWPGWVFFSTTEAWPDTDCTVRPDPEWVGAVFDLSDFAGLGEVVIRWVLVSDRTVAAPYANVYLQESGVLVDNILIADAEDNVFLSNNADDDPAPGELVARVDPGFGGDHWELASGEGRQHSGEWSMWHDDDYYRSLNAIDSPPFELPEDMNIWFQFWVWCDMPDYDSDGDTRLDDFYEVYLSDDEGETWARLLYDYARSEAGGDGWVHYLPGTHWLPDYDQNLSEWAGETVQLRWLFWADGDENDGNGAGLFIDDIEVLAGSRYIRDAGMRQFHLPYPTTVDYRFTGITVECHNLGIRDLTQIPGRWGRNDGVTWRSVPINQHPDLGADEFEVLELTDHLGAGWMPRDPGLFEIGARTTVGLGNPDPGDDDENFDNDSVGVAGVRIWPAGLYEMGYDNRTMLYAYNFDPGSGPAARFSPGELGLDEFTLAWLHFRFNGEQDVATSFALHILGAGDEQSPGEELFSLAVDVPVDSCLPHHMVVPLTGFEELRGMRQDFWVWVEVQREDHWPQIIGDELRWGQGRYFSYDGQDAVPFDGDLMMHAVVAPAVEAAPNLAASASKVDFGLVNQGEWGVRRVILFSAGLGAVTVNDMRAESEVFEVVWRGEITLETGKTEAFDVIFTPPDDQVHRDTLIIVSDDQTPPVVALVGEGAMGVGDMTAEQPMEFGISAPVPNPFNSLARVEFALEEPGAVSLKLYDLSGRVAANLLDGWCPAGRHSVILDGADLPAGIYLLRLKVEGRVAVTKAALIR